MMPDNPPVFRFAPSPTGLLHLGHVYCALLNQRLAREMHGRLLLRIEDIDRSRCRAAFEVALLDDLAWLGLEWERPVRKQSQHLAEYAAALDQLKMMGLVYPTLTSRREAAALAQAQGPAWPCDPDGVPLYAGQERGWSERQREQALREAGQVAWRLDMRRAIEMVETLTWQEADEGLVAADPAAWGDVVLARPGSPTSYHLSVVVDDALQGITHVVRGQDLRAATSVHRLLQVLLGLPQPHYRHHRLILGKDGQKLSKRDGAQGLAHWRQAGASPEEVAALVGL